MTAVVSATAAIIAALIAAWTASKRQQAQLSHDAHRQTRELTHDRQLRDVQELRDVLDDAAGAMSAASAAILEFHSAAQARSPHSSTDHAESERLYAVAFELIKRRSISRAESRCESAIRT